MKRSAVAGVVFLAALASSAVEVTKDWQIVYPDKAVGAHESVDWAMARFAGYLADDIREATGFRPKVVAESKAAPGTRGIWLGPTAAKKAGFRFDAWQDFENAYAVTNGNVYCFGNDHSGRKDNPYYWWMPTVLPSVRAATRLMYDLAGVRYVMPGPNGTAVPKRARLVFPDGVYSHDKPRFRFGSTHASVETMPFFYANGEFPRGAAEPYSGHSYHWACPTSLVKEHPEYFGLRGGRRVTDGTCTPLCISNPAVQELVYAELKKQFDNGAEIVLLGQSDGDQDCECEKCRTLFGTKDDFAERVWIFHRKLAERALKEYPGRTVMLLSYHQTKHPPKTFTKFPSNVMVQLCSANWDEWAKCEVPRGYSVYLYLWGDYRALGLTPKRSFASLRRKAKELIDHKVKGVYRCSSAELPGLEGPQYYYFDRALVNPDAPIGDVLQEFCDAAFGVAAAEPMRRFYEALDMRLRAYDAICGTGWWEADGISADALYTKIEPKDPLDYLSFVYMPEVVSTMDGCLAAAKRCPLTAREKARLERVELEWRYARNLGRIALLYKAFKASPCEETLKPLAAEVKGRQKFLGRIFDEKGAPRKLKDWPGYSLFAGKGRKLVESNGCLGAVIREPLTWDTDRMLRDHEIPGATGDVARWKKYNAEKGLKPITGWKPDRQKPGQVFELRPDGKGFVFDPTTNLDLRVRAAVKGLKPKTRYRISCFVKLEDVRVDPRLKKPVSALQDGFYLLVQTDRENDFLLPRGRYLTGSCDWQRLSGVFTTGDIPANFTSSVRFRLLNVRGRAEVEDVTLEEMDMAGTAKGLGS